MNMVSFSRFFRRSQPETTQRRRDENQTQEGTLDRAARKKVFEDRRSVLNDFVNSQNQTIPSSVPIQGATLVFDRAFTDYAQGEDDASKLGFNFTDTSDSPDNLDSPVSDG